MQQNRKETISKKVRPLQNVLYSLRDFGQFLPQLLAFGVFFRVLALAIFGPLTAWIIGTLIAFSGNPAISNTDIIAFLLSPAGVLWILITMTLSSTSSFVEQTGVMALGSARFSGQQVPLIRAIGSALKNMPQMLGLALLQSSIYLMIFLPFAGAGALAYFGLLSQYNINYYLTYTPPSFWTAIGIALTLLLVLALLYVHLYLRWIFSVPAIVFERRAFYASLRRSRVLMAGNFRRVGTTIIAWWIMMAFSTIVIMSVLQATGNFLLDNAGGNLSLLVGISGFILAFTVITSLTLSFMNGTVSSLLILRLYFERMAEKRVTPSFSPMLEAEENADIGGRKISYHWIVWPVAVLVLLLAALMALGIMESLDIDTNIDVTAHRGYSAVAPENTISAIQKAAEAGADFAEIDVQETADGTLVLLHDDDLMKVAGLDKKIWEVTFDEIKDVDVGSWFSPGFKEERIATLDQAIDVAQGKIKLMIELKYNGHDQKLAERVVELIRAKGFGSQCVLHSLNYEGLMEAKSLAPQLKVGYIVGITLGDISRVNTDFLNLESSLATTSAMDTIKSQGKDVAVWTVNKRDDMITMIIRGADNIVTDDPKTLLAVQQEMSELNDTQKVLLAFGDWLDSED